MRKSQFQAPHGLVLGRKGHADSCHGGDPLAHLLQVGHLVRGKVFSYRRWGLSNQGKGFTFPLTSHLPPPPEKKRHASFQFIWFFLGAVQTIQMFALALKFSSYVAFVLGHFAFWRC